MILLLIGLVGIVGFCFGGVVVLVGFSLLEVGFVLMGWIGIVGLGCLGIVGLLLLLEILGLG